MENADLDEIGELINQLSKEERKKLFANLKRVTFNFQINRSFLTGSHPLTIPKEYYSFLDFHGIVAKKNMTIVFPDGSTAVGYIYHGRAGYGAYRQIKIRNAYTGQGLSRLRVGDVVKVEIYKEGSLLRIQLSNPSTK
jgi:hypothetical protein